MPGVHPRVGADAPRLFSEKTRCRPWVTQTRKGSGLSSRVFYENESSYPWVTRAHKENGFGSRAVLRERSRHPLVTAAGKGCGPSSRVFYENEGSSPWWLWLAKEVVRTPLAVLRERSRHPLVTAAGKGCGPRSRVFPENEGSSPWWLWLAKEVVRTLSAVLRERSLHPLRTLACKGSWLSSRENRNKTFRPPLDPFQKGRWLLLENTRGKFDIPGPVPCRDFFGTSFGTGVSKDMSLPPRLEYETISDSVRRFNSTQDNGSDSVLGFWQRNFGLSPYKWPQTLAHKESGLTLGCFTGTKSPSLGDSCW